MVGRKRLMTYKAGSPWVGKVVRVQEAPWRKSKGREVSCVHKCRSTSLWGWVTRRRR